MKTIFATISTICLAGTLGIGTAQALPRADVAMGTASSAATTAEKARLVCNHHRCWHVGYYRHYWYRPYGYYRPYIGIGVGPFGVHLF